MPIITGSQANLNFRAYYHVSEIITISNNEGAQCHIHGHILKERASALYESADWETSNCRANTTVQASGDMLQLFTNWIYNGVLRLPEEHEKSGNPLTFEATCQRALEDAQKGLPITAQHRWIKREGEEYSVRGKEIPQLRMARLIELFEFAYVWNIVELEQDILESLFVTLKVAQELPNWDIVKDACRVRGDGRCDLFNFLVELFVANWSSDVSQGLDLLDEDQINATFAAAVLYSITFQKEESVREGRLGTLRAVTAEGKLKAVARELSQYKNALASAQGMLTISRRALADAKANMVPPRSVEMPVNEEIPAAKGKAAVKRKPAVRRKPVAKARPAVKPTPAQANKRPREEDDVYRSEKVEQSLKRSCRELRPRNDAVRREA